jgi:type II secretory pathway pseudopilin PulG
LKGQSRSTLFLIEQLLVILIFSICAAVCITIFVESYLMSKNTRDVSYAIRVAGNAAESYKAAGGNAYETLRLLHGAQANHAVNDNNGGLFVYYDDSWNTINENAASFVLRIQPVDYPAPDLVHAEVVIRRVTGEEMYRLSVTARSGGER